ncbi:unnamed protein product [Clonostachys rhizophaga]|uniref:FAD dependent oxidoreductase domain-containing protein n=1 Tax=Clonostachys rhizophaga TaxID=160324 RepID=A0A9N9YJZ0_9HYPO|nr:unnamed protein product [Clonostachys rhizophaga]
MAAPATIIIIGSGVFGLSTAYAASRDPRFGNSKIILVDRWNFEPESSTTSVQNPGAANADTSRVIRRDYPHPHDAYAALALEALTHWRAEWGENGRYTDQRLLFAAEGSSIEGPKRDGEIINYVKDAYELSIDITPGGKDALKVVDSLAAIRAELGLPSTNPTNIDKDSNALRGYISDDCGWANAGASIEYLRQKVVKLGRVQFVVGQVGELIQSDDKAHVKGVKLLGGTEILGDLTVVAGGGQSPRILGLKDLCDVYNDVVAFIQLTQAECDELRRRKWPLIVNVNRGVFAIGPDGDNCLKLGHFSHSGIVDALKSAKIELGPRKKTLSAEQEWADPDFGWGGDVQLTELGDLVDDDKVRLNKTLADYRLFLIELLGPSSFDSIDTVGDVKYDSVLNSIAVRPFTRIRKCWYTDRPSLDFIVDYHPSFGKSLFVATGGGDHAFKFLPVIGEKIVELILYQQGVKAPALRELNPSVEELSKLWKFPDDLLK